MVDFFLVAEKKTLFIWWRKKKEVTFFQRPGKKEHVTFCCCQRQKYNYSPLLQRKKKKICFFFVLKVKWEQQNWIDKKLRGHEMLACVFSKRIPLITWIKMSDLDWEIVLMFCTFLSFVISTKWKGLSQLFFKAPTISQHYNLFLFHYFVLVESYTF